MIKIGQNGKSDVVGGFIIEEGKGIKLISS